METAGEGRASESDSSGHWVYLRKPRKERDKTEWGGEPGEVTPHTPILLDKCGSEWNDSLLGAHVGKNGASNQKQMCSD